MSERIVQQPSSTSHQQHFAEMPSAEVERSTFDRSHGYKGTLEQAGRLYPILVDEILPGDTFNVEATVFARLATPLKPLMDNMHADVHYFFVPNRLVWDNWTRFMGERRGPDDDPENYSIPQANIDLQAAKYGSLADHMGLPIGQPGSISVTDLPFRAYELIFYEWYRDQNIQDFLELPYTGDGTSDRTDDTCKYRGKRKDYFTSALPWPQKGDPVVIPIAASAPVKLSDQDASPNNLLTYQGQDGNLYYLDANPTTGDVSLVGGQPSYPNAQGLIADLAQATSTSINDLRTAFQIQKLLERDARGGTRYIELVLSHFGVQSDDARLQRPEFLGAGSAAISINPVASTAAVDPTGGGTDLVPQGNLAATGTGLVKAGFNHSFTEHGYVIGILSVRADLTYQNGVERMWSRQTRYDFYWPALSHLGEQAIKNKEIFVSEFPEYNEDVFAYQERYAEYRYKPGRITGLMRSNATESLDTWHLAQDFTEGPQLNNQFIIEKPPVERVIAVPSEPHFLVDVWFKMTCTRPMPVYSVPGMIDHF